MIYVLMGSDAATSWFEAAFKNIESARQRTCGRWIIRATQVR